MGQHIQLPAFPSLWLCQFPTGCMKFLYALTSALKLSKTEVLGFFYPSYEILKMTGAYSYLTRKVQ